MAAIALALLSALSYGSGDFVAGLMSRRMHYARVSGLAQLAAVAAVLVAAPLAGGELTARGLFWGAVSGIGSGVGTVALYRGLGRGQMNVAGPISGAGSAALPVIAGLVLGERPSAVTLVGVVLVLPAVWLISSSGGLRITGMVEGAVDGLLAGLGFGTLFLALSRAGDDTGLWPALVGNAVSLVIIAAFVIPTVRRQRTPVAAPWRTRLGALGAGVLSATATVTFLLSTRHGLLVVVSVLAALYPGITVLLARFVLREHSSRVQLVGLGLGAVAVVAITVG